MKRKQIVAIVLAVALMGSLAGITAFAAGSQKTGKTAAVTAADKADAETSAPVVGGSETVYVIANADGSAKKVIVSQQYDSGDAQAAEKAKASLTDPQNVKGDNCWQGTTDKALPVTMAVSYTLDGKAVSADALAGKSGHVTMRFDYTNTHYETKAIGGKKETIYVPFAVLTGTLLDSDRFTNVSVTNGRLVDDGDHTVVVGMAFPGLQEDLALNTDKLTIPSYVEIEADVTDFALDTTLTVVSNSLFSDLDDGKLDDSALDDLSADMDKLTDAMSQLMDGSGELYDGLDTLLRSSQKLADGVDQLTDGLTELDANSARLNAGAETVFNSLLSTVNSQLAANEALATAGINVPTLTISNYSEVLNGVIAALDPSGVTETAKAIALEQVTAAVRANEETIRTGVTEKVRAEVSSQVEDTVTAMVTEQVRAQVWQQILTNAGIDQDTYNALSDEEKAPLDAALADQLPKEMQREEVQQQISDTVVKTVDDKMASAEITAQIAQLTEAQIDALIEQNMNSEEVQQQISNAVGEAKTGVAQLSAVLQQLDSYSVFYTGLKTYTAGVAQARAGAAKLDSNMPDLIDGVKKLRDGAGELSNGLKELNDEGIQRLVDALDGDLELLGDRLRATCDVSRNYRGFTSQSGDGVKFIFRTEAIEVKE